MAHRIPQEEQTAQKLTAHRGLATWGEKLVPLGDFRKAADMAGVELSPEERQAAAADFLDLAQIPPMDTPIEGPFHKVVVFGGVYNNHLALEALLDKAHEHGAEALYCLGDLGGFGPHPLKTWELLEGSQIRTLQGNYEESLSSGREDCNCGYTDPRDNHFADVSYDYTAANSSPEFNQWMGELPRHRRIAVGERQLLLAHGSPRQINEFLFHSTSPVPFLEVLLNQAQADGFLCTHTGLHWHRRLASGRDAINVGVIGRPANDGRTHVCYCLLEAQDGELKVDLLPLEYDHHALAREMRREELPEEFVETILTGWWTTCLEILPARERALSHF